MNNGGNTSANVLRIILAHGNVGIGTTIPTLANMFQIGNTGRLKISSGTTDFILLGTIDTDSSTNTRIVLSGNTRSSPYTASVEYYAACGNHIFDTNGTEVSRI